MATQFLKLMDAVCMIRKSWQRCWQQLGISGWSGGRDWRATGFFGHWVTYAEVLQLIASLALGFFLALPSKRGWLGFLLLVALAGLLFALALTVTRASWVG